MLGAALLAAFINGAAAVYYTYTAEASLTAIRATGMGTASAIGRIGAIITPIGIGYLAAAGAGFSAIFLCLVGLLVFALVVVILFGPKTAGKHCTKASKNRCPRTKQHGVGGRAYASPNSVREARPALRAHVIRSLSAIPAVPTGIADSAGCWRSERSKRMGSGNTAIGCRWGALMRAHVRALLWAAREMDAGKLERAITASTERKRELLVVGEVAAARQAAADKMVCVSVRARRERSDESGGEITR